MDEERNSELTQDDDEGVTQPECKAYACIEPTSDGRAWELIVRNGYFETIRKWSLNNMQEMHQDEAGVILKRNGYTLAESGWYEDFGGYWTVEVF